MQNNNYRIERLSSENIHLLSLLYRDVFKKKVSVTFFQRKYSTKAFGPEFIGYLAIADKNFPAAFYGVIPCIIQIESKEILTAQSADTMTHAHHRNQGLFKQLALKTYALAKENNIKFIFGFPNENSLPGFKKLGWEFLPENLKLFTMPASRIPYSKFFFKSRALSWIYTHIVKLLLEQDGVRQTIFSSSDSSGVKHDIRFMEYKTYSYSFYTRLGQADLWLKIDSAMKIGFVHFLKNRRGDELLEKLRVVASLLGCSSVSFITHEHSILYNALSDIIKPVDSLPIGFYNLCEEKFQYDRLGFEYCDIDIF